MRSSTRTRPCSSRGLFVFPKSVRAAVAGDRGPNETVTSIPQSESSTASFLDGFTGFLNSCIGKAGMYAKNSGAKRAIAWHSLMTTGTNGSSVRSPQVGDQFQMTVNASAAFGGIGFSLNDDGTQGGSHAHRIGGPRLFVEEADTMASREVNSASDAGGYTSLNDDAGMTTRDYTFDATTASESTAHVQMAVNGSLVSNGTFNMAIIGSAGANIDAYSSWPKDDWNGTANQDVLWKQETAVENTGAVEIGSFLASGNLPSGRVTDGLAADSTVTPSVHVLFIEGEAGSQVTLDQDNIHSVGCPSRFEIAATLATLPWQARRPGTGERPGIRVTALVRDCRAFGMAFARLHCRQVPATVFPGPVGTAVCARVESPTHRKACRFSQEFVASPTFASRHWSRVLSRQTPRKGDAIRSTRVGRIAPARLHGGANRSTATKRIASGVVAGRAGHPGAFAFLNGAKAGFCRSLCGLGRESSAWTYVAVRFARRLVCGLHLFSVGGGDRRAYGFSSSTPLGG